MALHETLTVVESVFRCVHNGQGIGQNDYVHICFGHKIQAGLAYSKIDRLSKILSNEPNFELSGQISIAEIGV